MVRLVSRRALLGGAAVLPAACMSNNPPPAVGIQPLPAGADLSLGPSEGLVVGVVALALNNLVDMSREWRSRQTTLGTFVHWYKLVFADATDRRYDVPVAPIGNDATEVSDAGAKLFLTPFAFKVPAGQCRVIAGAHVTGTNWWPRWVTPAEFDATASRVTYIGRLGRLQNRVLYQSRAELDAACSTREGSALGTPTCWIDALFTDSKPDQDLPLIRNLYASLNARTIDIKPVRPPRDDWHQHWRLWPDALQAR